MKAAKLVVLALVVGLFGSGCVTYCVVGVREGAAVVCGEHEEWSTCLPKVEAHLQKAQDEAIRLVKKAAEGAGQ